MWEAEKSAFSPALNLCLVLAPGDFFSLMFSSRFRNPRCSIASHPVVFGLLPLDRSPVLLCGVLELHMLHIYGGGLQAVESQGAVLCSNLAESRSWITA